MLPLQNKEMTEREKLIANLKAEIEVQERRGHFDTPHHDMLKQLLQADKKSSKVKEETKE